jgi:hypothetical protein
MITKKEIKGLIKEIKVGQGTTNSLIEYYVGKNTKYNFCQSNVNNEYHKDNLIVFTTRELETLEKINVENVLEYLNNKLSNL